MISMHLLLVLEYPSGQGICRFEEGDPVLPCRADNPRKSCGRL
jgi:hypothetical protein